MEIVILVFSCVLLVFLVRTKFFNIKSSKHTEYLEEAEKPTDFIPNENEKPNFIGEILLCEDNIINQETFKSHFVDVGLSVVIVNNGKECVDIIKNRLENKEKLFDLIFMDIQMPIMNGIEAADWLTKEGVNVPVVALTANATEQDKKIYKEHNMSECLAKPFTKVQLWGCLYKYFTAVSHEEINEEKKRQEADRLQTKLFTNFVKRNQHTYEEISNAIRIGDLTLAHRHVHTLKGLAGLMKKSKLQEAAAIVERNLAPNSTDAPDEEKLELLKYELESVLKELAPYLENSNENHVLPNTEYDKDKAKKLFEKLELLLEGDSAECLMLIDELKKIPNTANLISQIDDYEFEAAIDALHNLKEKLKL